MTRPLTGGSYQCSWKTGYSPNTFALSKEKKLFFITDMWSSGMEEVNLDGRCIRQQNIHAAYWIAASNKYLCMYIGDRKVYLLSLNKYELIKKWTLLEFCSGLAMDETSIYVSGKSFFFIYSFEGILLRSWKLPTDKYTGRRIALIQNKIFMVDSLACSISVFSIKGNIMYKWGTKGQKVGELNHPKGIAVTTSVVFLVDAGHNRIQTYTHEGQFLFNLNYPTKELPNTFENAKLEEIFELENMLYVTDTRQKSILVFKLT